MLEIILGVAGSIILLFVIIGCSVVNENEREPRILSFYGHTIHFISQVIIGPTGNTTNVHAINGSTGTAEALPTTPEG